MTCPEGKALQAARRPVDSQPLVAASKRERAKYAKYMAWAQAMGAAFMPCVFETHGAFGRTAKAVVAYLAEQYARHHAAGLEEVVRYRRRVIDRLAACLQLGNHLMLVRARGRAMPPALAAAEALRAAVHA